MVTAWVSAPGRGKPGVAGSNPVGPTIIGKNGACGKTDLRLSNKGEMMATKKEEKEIDIFQSDLVPKHEILSGEDKAELLKNLNVAPKQLPRISEEDPVVKILQAKRGDVIKITRDSLSAKEYLYYRIVV